MPSWCIHGLFFAGDIDVGVDVGSDQAFWRVFNRLADFGRVDGHSVVEVFPVDISPIIQDALTHANRKRVESVVVKVAPPEHLLLESLRVYRSQDKGRVFLLDEVVDREKLRALLRRLDHEDTLKQRYQALTGETP